MLNKVLLIELGKKMIGDGILVATASAISSYFVSRFIRNTHTNIIIKDILDSYIQQEKSHLAEDFLMDANETELVELTKLMTKQKQPLLLPNTILLYGAPGTGKTSFVRWLSRKKNYIVYEVSKIAYSCTEKGLTSIDVLQKIINYIHSNKKEGVINIIFIDELEIMLESKPFVHQFFANFGEINRPGKNIILFATTNKDPIAIDEKIRQRFEKIVLFKNSLEKTALCFKKYLKLYFQKTVGQEQIIKKLQEYTKHIENVIREARMTLQMDPQDKENAASFNVIHTNRNGMEKILYQIHHPLKEMLIEVEKIFFTFFDPETMILLVSPRNIINIIKDSAENRTDFPLFSSFDKIIFCTRVAQLQQECFRLRRKNNLQKTDIRYKAARITKMDNIHQ